MANGFKRWWGYLKAKTNSTLEERADPKVQLEQAIREAQDQHRRLREQAANVIANRNQTEHAAQPGAGELEKVNGNARQALRMADDAEKKGDTAHSRPSTSVRPRRSPTASSSSRRTSRT